MMSITMNRIAFFTLVLIGFSAFAQTPKDTLNTEIIEVVKPYVPTIPDAFKIKENPVLEEQVVPKETVNYSINSAPVASTFIPEKGTAKGLKATGNEAFFNNYISFGFGNYTSPLLDAFVKVDQDAYSDFGVKLYHHSSQGGIKDVYLKDSYYDTKAGVFYNQNTSLNDMHLGVDIKHGYYNWYGISESIPVDDSYDVSHAYFGIKAGGTLEKMEANVFKGGNVSLGFFKDNFNSNEIRFTLQPKLEFPISTENLELMADVDYLSGKYQEDTNANVDESYGFVKFGLLPNFKFTKDNLNLNLGLKAYLLNDQMLEETNFAAFPNVDVSYHISPNNLTVYGGATGGYTYNTYNENTEVNPFLSTDFYSRPTKEKYRLYAGLKGKLESATFDINGFFRDVENLPMYVIQPTRSLIVPQTLLDNYSYFTQFNMVYDSAKNMGIKAHFETPILDYLNLGANLEYNIYNMANELEAWNLPALQGNVYANLNYNEWQANAELLLRGETYDTEYSPYIYYNFITAPNPEDLIVKNASFADLNLSVSYNFNKQLSVFARAHNIFSNNYERFYNYPNQGIQFLGGITYKFDLH